MWHKSLNTIGLYFMQPSTSYLSFSLHIPPGYTVNLVKENTVYAGHHELLLKVFDLQGQGALHNLSVTVCDCSRVASCRIRRATGSKIGESAVGIVIAAMLLVLGI